MAHVGDALLTGLLSPSSLIRVSAAHAVSIATDAMLLCNTLRFCFQLLMAWNHIELSSSYQEGTALSLVFLYCILLQRRTTDYNIAHPLSIHVVSKTKLRRAKTMSDVTSYTAAADHDRLAKCVGFANHEHEARASLLTRRSRVWTDNGETLTEVR